MTNTNLVSLAALLLTVLTGCAGTDQSFPGASDAATTSPPLILVGAWSGTSTIALTATAPINFAASVTVDVNPRTRAAVVTGLCKGASNAVTMTGTVGSAYWTGSFTCPSTMLGFTQCPNVTMTYTAGSIIATSDGSLIAQFEGTATSEGANCSSYFQTALLLFVGTP